MTVGHRKPLSTIRSQWRETTAEIIPGRPAGTWAERNVTDGQLRVAVTNEPEVGYHLSISHVGHGNRIRRYPSWDEIADARDVFLPPDLEFVMVLPKARDYVALHDTTFHLHEFPLRGRS